MDDEGRLKAYSGMADVSRKWVSTFDTKASFLSGLSAATLAFIWTGAKLADTPGLARSFALCSTSLLLLSLVLALRVVLPRVSLWHAHRKDLEYVEHYHPVSYYQYVAENFPADKHAEFVALVNELDTKALAREALEQHYTICHVLRKKSNGVAFAGWSWLLACILLTCAMVARG